MNGEFQIEIDDQVYPSVFICKDYKSNFLEYWHWNFRPKANDFLYVKIGGLELYGLQAWEARPAYPGLMMFFRPMSLQRYKNLGAPDKNTPLLIAPDLDVADLKVKIDGRDVGVLGLNAIKEFISDKQYLNAYLVHISLDGIESKIHRISLDIVDSETGERGMASFDLN